jgi:hypothetical protein
VGGADGDLFHQGAAKESRDPDVIAATMATPGVVLKRPVGRDLRWTRRLPKSFLHHGISARNFKRQFTLADHVEVRGARFENGLLIIDLQREIPEAMKPRRIAINGATPSSVTQIDSRAAWIMASDIASPPRLSARRSHPFFRPLGGDHGADGRAWWQRLRF